jgi:hypothetical protein
MDYPLPELNARIKRLVSHFTEGNVTKFVSLLNEKLPAAKKISQQKFNRIFNIDSRTKKFPNVPPSVITAITERFDIVNKTWLLAGDGEMLKSQVGNSPDEKDSKNIPGQSSDLQELLKTQLDILKRLEFSLDYNTKRILINEAIVRTHLHHSARVEARETGRKYQDIIADLNKASEAIFEEIFSKSEAAVDDLKAGA